MARFVPPSPQLRRRYPLDNVRPEIFRLLRYLKDRLSVEDLPTEFPEHPLLSWCRAGDAFRSEFEKKGGSVSDLRDRLNANVTAAVILANDLDAMENDQLLQDRLVKRLRHPHQFQGALFETSVSATMTRAGFALTLEDEGDPATKHPEFIATHRKAATRIAVEAKSIHRRGVLGSTQGAPVPTLNTVDSRKVATSVRRQVVEAMRQAPSGMPLYVFVDLNLPPRVAEKIAEPLQVELADLLGQLEEGYDHNGIFAVRTLIFVVVTNRPMLLGEERHQMGDSLNVFIRADRETCRYPEAYDACADVQAALDNYGTVAVWE